MPALEEYRTTNILPMPKKAFSKIGKQLVGIHSFKDPSKPLKMQQEYLLGRQYFRAGFTIVPKIKSWRPSGK